MSEAASEESLARLERAVTRMEVVLQRHPPQFDLPRSAVALFGAPLPVLDAASLGPADRVRLARVLDRLEAVRAELRRRQRHVAGRLNAVSAALRHSRAAGTSYQLDRFS